MTDGITELTDFGFKFGAAEVSRYTVLPDGTVVVGIATDAGRSIDVYVSPAGRRIRVFSKGKEWKP